MVRWVERRGAEEGLGQFGRGVSALVRLPPLLLNGACSAAGPSASPQPSDPGHRPRHLSAQKKGCSRVVHPVGSLMAGIVERTGRRHLA